jgi:hypothetical protein
MFVLSKFRSRSSRQYVDIVSSTLPWRTGHRRRYVNLPEDASKDGAIGSAVSAGGFKVQSLKCAPISAQSAEFQTLDIEEGSQRNASPLHHLGCGFKHADGLTNFA